MRALAGLLLASWLVGCATEVNRDGAWALADLTGAPKDAPLPTLAISSAHLSGFTGCNRVAGEIETDANVATFFRGGLAVTEMYCEAGEAMAMERAFLAALNRARDARIVAGELVFFDVNNREIMRFRRAPS
jgi:heat shock protein HslJ